MNSLRFGYKKKHNRCVSRRDTKQTKDHMVPEKIKSINYFDKCRKISICFLFS